MAVCTELKAHFDFRFPEVGLEFLLIPFVWFPCRSLLSVQGFVIPHVRFSTRRRRLENTSRENLVREKAKKNGLGVLTIRAGDRGGGEI